MFSVVLGRLNVGISYDLKTPFLPPCNALFSNTFVKRRSSSTLIIEFKNKFGLLGHTKNENTKIIHLEPVFGSGDIGLSAQCKSRSRPVIAAFDFGNATAGVATAAASTTGAGISGAVFGGSNGSSSVFTGMDNIYTSNALFPGANRMLFNYFTFTTATSLDLGALTFESGQNDIPNGARTFEVRLSPAGTATPIEFESR